MGAWVEEVTGVLSRPQYPPAWEGWTDVVVFDGEIVVVI